MNKFALLAVTLIASFALPGCNQQPVYQQPYPQQVVVAQQPAYYDHYHHSGVGSFVTGAAVASMLHRPRYVYHSNTMVVHSAPSYYSRPTMVSPYRSSAMMGGSPFRSSGHGSFRSRR